MSYWLLKSEPDDYSYDDLVADGRAPWDGVTAPPAQSNMRKMAAGDGCIFYHTGGQRAAVALAKIERGPYPDPGDASGRRVLVDVSPGKPLSQPVPLATLRPNPEFEGSPLVRMSRLSVVPLTKAQYEEILRLGNR